MTTPVAFDPWAASTPDAPPAAKPVAFDPFAAAKTGGAEGVAPAPTDRKERGTKAIEPGQVKLRKGMTDKQIAEVFGYDYEEIKKAGDYREGALAGLISEENPGATLHNTFLSGAGLEAADSVFGKYELAGRLVNRASGGKFNSDIAYAHLMRNVIKSNQLNNVEMGRRVSKNGQQELNPVDIGGMLDPLSLTKIKALGRVSNAAIQGFIGGATSTQDQASPDVGSREDTYGKTALQRGGVGTVAGPIISKTGEGVVGAVGKGVNMARGIREVDSNPGFVDAAREANIPFTMRDVYPASGTLRGVEQASGDSARQEASRVAARDAAADKVAAFKSDMLATPFPNSKALQRAAADKNHPRHDEAKALVSHIRNPSEDWSDAIDASGRLEIFNAKLKSDRMYAAIDRVGVTVPNVPTTHVEMVLKKIQAERAKGSIGGLPNDYLKMLNNMEVGTAKPIANFADAREQRKQLAIWQAKAASMEGNPGPSKITEDFKAIKEAKTEDMKLAATAVGKPNLSKKLADADEEYKHTAEVSDSMLAKAVEKKPELADEVVKLMTEGGKDRAKLLFRSLGKRGQAAVSYKIVDDAFKKAMSDELRRFDPKVFARAIQAKEDELGVFLAGNDKNKIMGFSNMMAHFQSVDSNAAAVQAERTTRLATSGAGVGAGQGSPIPSTVMGVVGNLVGRMGLDKAMNNPAWQKYWLAASDLKPGSKAMEHLSSYMLPALAREAGRRAGEREPTRHGKAPRMPKPEATKE